MNRWAVILCVGALALTGLDAIAAAPATRPARPTTAVANDKCVTPDCHPSIKALPVLHGPVAVNACDACHQLKDASRHTFSLLRDKADLCTYCHDFNVSNMPVIHKPVKDGQCGGCHDPHGGLTHALLREESISATCNRCHDSVTRGMTAIHSPVNKGQCTNCHPPHASRQPKLLDAKGTDLCLTCHTDLAARLASAKVTHKALQQGCEKCHAAHGSTTPMQLTAAALDLCKSCHEKTVAQAASALHKHSPVFAGRACLTCHTVHAGPQPALLADQPVKVCLSCHDKPLPLPAGAALAAVAELTQPALTRHGAIKDGQCGPCHNAHGNDHPLFLVKSFATDFYEPYSPDKYELCLSCHDKQLAQEPQTDTHTQFRNGKANLHFAHVNSKTVGRTCGVCHQPHAANNDRSMRPAVQHKAWLMPINFRRTPTGGSCAPGCHLPYAYDRDKPLPTTMPADPDPDPVARPLPERETLVRWTGKDIASRPAAIPDPTRLSLLVIVAANDAPAAAKALSAATEAAQANIVLIICGQDAPAQAASAGNLAPPNTAIIADPDYRLAHQLGVTGWPVSLIVRSDGRESARVGGELSSLALRLPAYFATPTTQPATRPAPPDTVDRGPQREAQRLAAIAIKLLDQGKPALAEKLLTDALAAQPDRPELRLAMARTLAALGKGRESLRLLDQLPDSALPEPDRQALRARALIAMNLWDEAKTALNKALLARPDFAQAHYLLGQVYEHQELWQQAAQEYRASHESGRE